MFYCTNKKYTHLFTPAFVSESNVTPSYSFQLAHSLHAHFVFVFDFRLIRCLSTFQFWSTRSIPIVSPPHLSTIILTHPSTLWRQGTPPERLLAHFISLLLLLFYWISFRYCWQLRSISVCTSKGEDELDLHLHVKEPWCRRGFEDSGNLEPIGDCR